MLVTSQCWDSGMSLVPCLILARMGWAPKQPPTERSIAKYEFTSEELEGLM